MKAFFYFFLVTWLSLMRFQTGFAASAQSSEKKSSDMSLREKVEALEQRLHEIDARELEFQQEGKNRVQTFLAEHISFGGFFEHSITNNLSKDHFYQLAADSHIFGLNLGVKLNDKFRLVSQELFVLSFPLLKEPDVTQRTFSSTVSVGALVAHAYGEYTASEKFRIEMGLGWAPFGIAMANREFPLYLRHNGPQIASAGLTMPFALWEGLHALGEFSTAMGAVGYNLYSLTSTTSSNRVGGGSRLWWASPQEHVKIGTSSQIVDWGTDSIFNVGGDVEFKVKPLGLRAEYARSATAGDDIWTVYGEPYIELAKGKWIIHGEVDYAKRPTQAGDAATFLPFERWQLGGGINWLPWTFLRTRLLFLYNNHVGISATTAGLTNDYYTLQYSTGIEF